MAAGMWRCVLVGGESLLVECAEMLRKRGHDISAVVATGGRARQWAQRQGLRTFAAAGDLLEAGDLGTFDYLFSITNLAIVPDPVLQLPTRRAINFHDGPLPDIGGLNVTTWALMDGRPEHGVTWHVMTSQVDEGEVLAQARFPVASEETAHSLNLKCFEAGIATFEQLLMALDVPASAPPPIPSRPLASFFGPRHRPPAGGVLRWDRPAAEIARMVRALDFGERQNPIARARFALGGRVVCVGSAEVRGPRTGNDAGSVLGCGPWGIELSAADRDLRLSRLTTLDGQPLTLDPDGPAGPGALLETISDLDAERLHALASGCARHERHWRQRIAALEGDVWPWDEAATTEPTDGAVEVAEPGLDAGARARPGAGAWIAAVVGLWARLTDRDVVEFAYEHPSLRRSVAGLEPWFAPAVPMQVPVSFDAPVASLEAAVQRLLTEAEERETFATDLIVRSPDLHGRAGHHGRPPQSLGVQRVATGEDPRHIDGCAVTLSVVDDGERVHWFFDPRRTTVERVRWLHRMLVQWITASSADPATPIGQLRHFAARAGHDFLEGPQAPAADGPADTSLCVHRQFSRRAAQVPSRIAVSDGERSMTFAELDQASNRLARHLQRLGVGPETRVGVMLDRSVDLVATLLAILKAGGAYVPLDPAYPAERVAFMSEDAALGALVTQDRWRSRISEAGLRTVRLDADAAAIAAEAATPVDSEVGPSNAAYVIYTSGSTGRPKGVVIEHRNLAGFMRGIDRVVPIDDHSAWLAVTSLNFDISVLELLWTVARGVHVVVADGDVLRSAAMPSSRREIDFSLFYFSGDGSTHGAGKYDLLLKGAQFADQNDFTAVWTPERHFHAFGGLYPNPAVTGAAVAALTRRVQIRAGSVVLPLHHPIRVAEEWSVVDNLSGGRAAVAFASGWHPNDFVLNPPAHADMKAALRDGIAVVRKLWRGESHRFPGPGGREVEVSTLPRPLQKELPFWITAAGNIETFREAGRMGANLLTHLLGQSLDELSAKVAAYREARREAGHEGDGCVSLMLHTFVGPDAGQVREVVRQPLIDYLKTSVHLVQQYASSFPAFRRAAGEAEPGRSPDLSRLDAADMASLLEHAFERYFETSGLFGTPQSCMSFVEAVSAAGVDDIACLVDFGVDPATVLAHLPHLAELRRLATQKPRPGLVELMRRYEVTHLQCTPSLARMALADADARASLGQLRCMLVGGEALPAPTARELTALWSRPTLRNMYGPTETTIWSSAHEVGDDIAATVPLGRPLEGQQILLVDRRLQPVPQGQMGEIVIAGVGVARGYLGRPALTAERFVAAPAPVRGRAYRTGDLGRLAPDGRLEFLGRADHQVKLRGHRIEIGEIEAALLAEPGVSAAAATVHALDGDAQIVGYVTARPGASVDVAKLREALLQRLPAVMVPSHILALDELPQTPNGKLDRAALPMPQVRSHEVAEADLPATPTERAVATLWEQLLGVEQLGVHEDFFALGGHSLLAVQLQIRLRDALRAEFSLADIFRAPTIHALAGRIDRQRARQPAEAMAS